VPNRDLIIGFTGDEETGMETTSSLATEYRELTDAEYVLNADGGGGFLDHDRKAIAYLIQAAEKTFATFELTIRNPGGHSSLPRPDNAIYELATVLKNIEAYTFPNEEVNAAVSNAVHKQHPDIPIIPYMAPYGTDGKVMRLAGMPTYGVMGLFFRPEDEFAHGLNERVQVDSFFGALEYWHDILTDLAGD